MPNYYNTNQQMLDNLYRQRNYIEGQINQYSQPQPVQPINNYINTGSNVDMEAKILKDNETIDGVMITRRTLFLDEKNKRVAIKETNGDISKEYELIVPMDEKDKKIQRLEKEIEKLKNQIGTIEDGGTDDKKHK